MSLQKLIALISIAILINNYTGIIDKKNVADGGYQDTVNEVIIVVDSGQGEND